MIKRSQRCRKCEHNLSKPEYNPTSIKFKIQLAAFYHIPEVIIYKLANSPLFPGSEYNFVLKFSNPTQHPTNVEIMPLATYFEAKKRKIEAETVRQDELDKPESEQAPTPAAATGGPQTRLPSAFLRQPTLVTASEKH